MGVSRKFVQILGSEARTGDTTSEDFDAEDVWSTLFFINVTADPGTASVVFSVEIKDPLSGAYKAILASSAVTSTGTTILQVGKEVASSNLATQIMLTSKFRITADHADEVQSMTYSVSATHLTIR